MVRRCWTIRLRPSSPLTRGFAALLVATAPNACDSPVGTEDGGSAPEILFVTGRDDVTTPVGWAAYEVYGIRQDGTRATNLTHAPAPFYRHLAFSPAGARLVFESDRSGCYNIWTMALDGSQATQLTGVLPDEGCNQAPRWSPDGTMIAFTTSRAEFDPGDLSWEVWVMGADGSEPRGVSHLESGDWAHGWTPDGRVVFNAIGPDGPTAWVAKPDGTERAHFLEPGDWAPYWSPDGTRVAFVRQHDYLGDIYVMNADGSGLTNLTNDPAHDSFDPWNTFEDPWSPDGNRIAFTSDRGGERDIWVVGVDGTGLHNVTAAAGDDEFNGWSPDGTRILFSSDRGGAWDVYTIDADGSNLVNVTSHPGQDRYAVWVPSASP